MHSRSTGANRLTPTVSSSSSISLSWTAVTPPTGCTISSYTVYGGTTANPTTLLATVTSGTSYTNTRLATFDPLLLRRESGRL